MLLIPLNPARATDTSPQIDANKVWKSLCFTCHGDSGDMARKNLKVVDGKLQGLLHKETFRTFLTNHYLSKPKADAVYAMLLAHLSSKSRFEVECSSCHKTALDIVRDKMQLSNGVLYGRESKTPVYTFLQTHQNLKQDDVTFFARKLTFLGYEVYQPVKME